MDISKPVTYRNLPINSATLETGRILRGITLETVDYSDVEAVGYTEKRAAADGLHASDVYLGARNIDMNGHVYGTNVAELFDFLHTLRSVFSPTSAYQESPGDRGFLPLFFRQPTLDLQSWPALTYPDGIPLYMNVRPLRPPRFSIARDRLTNGNKERPTATPWSVRLFAKDPRVYVNPPQIKPINATGAAVNVGDFATNRGDYETPFNILLVVGAAPGANQSFRITGLNGIDMTIKIENVANVVYRWFGDDRVLMTQDATGVTPPELPTTPLALRMDLVTFATKQRRPMVPAQIDPPSKPFSTVYHYWCTCPLAAGSRLFWSEAFA